MKCLTCGTDMICKIDGHCLSWSCPNCGDGVATSYFEPIEIDEVQFSIIIEKIVDPTKEQIKVTSQVLNVNYLTARNLLIYGNGTLTGKAMQIRESASILEQNGLSFSITPDFPYKIQ